MVVHYTGRRKRISLPDGRLEPRRPLTHYAEGALQREPDASQRTLVEQPADQGDAVGDAAWRREGGQRVVGVGRPVTARL